MHAPMTPQRCFIVGVVVLAVYNVARGLGGFGALDDAFAVVLLLAFVLLARGTRTSRGTTSVSNTMTPDAARATAGPRCCW